MQRPDQDSSAPSTLELGRLYTRTMALYLGLMYVLWHIGFEGIYGHPTPFYAIFAPAVGTPVAAALTMLCIAAGYLVCRRPGNLLQSLGWPFYLSGAFILAMSVAVGALWDRARDETAAAYLTALAPRLAWQLPALGVTLAGAVFLWYFVLPKLRTDAELDPHDTKRILLGIFGFSVLFACAIAMIRGGFQGIEQAYLRSAYEYIGDIGKTRNIRILFSQYLEIHEHLSMHSKVHPPGPIALLWIFSLLLLSTSPLTLSLATVVFSSLAVFPLYGWTKRIAGQRTALIGCLFYVVVPSVTLFTATSADALFTPFTLTCLYCFERSIRTRSAPFGLLAGLAYGAMILLKFSLIGIGAYFGLAGLWMLRRKATRLNVVITAVLMLAGTGVVLGGVYWWSGYDVYENFLVAKAQFDTDQRHLDALTPRLASWSYKILNPACWFYFAGIPLSLLFLRELLWGSRALRPQWIVFLLALIALNFLYLARGEGERSALYLIPFVLIPAAACIRQLTARKRCAGPLLLTLAFLAFQTWFTETFFYTYW